MGVVQLGVVQMGVVQMGVDRQWCGSSLAESKLDLSSFPRLPDGVLWRRAEALVLVVVVTAAKKAQ